MSFNFHLKLLRRPYIFYLNYISLLVYYFVSLTFIRYLLSRWMLLFIITSKLSHWQKYMTTNIVLLKWVNFDNILLIFTKKIWLEVIWHFIVLSYWPTVYRTLFLASTTTCSTAFMEKTRGPASLNASGTSTVSMCLIVTLVKTDFNIRISSISSNIFIEYGVLPQPSIMYTVTGFTDWGLSFVWSGISLWGGGGGGFTYRY